MNYKLIIGWLNPELMSTYGDRGNIIVLKKRCEWRGINLDVKTIDFKTARQEIEKCNLIFGGGAQDRQQGILIEDLRKNKGPILKKMFDKGIPGLFVCGAPQLLGHYYMTGDGTKLEGLGIFDMVSKHFGKDKPRCIGNTVAETGDEFRVPSLEFRKTIVGFENHGGRTYLKEISSTPASPAGRQYPISNTHEKNSQLESATRPFAKVTKGCGNNGEDGTEGAVYKNCIATYSHGPFLPKNSHIADWLISKSLEIKYKKKITLTPLDDTLEWQAHDVLLNLEN